MFIYLEDREKGVWHNLSISVIHFQVNAISGTGTFFHYNLVHNSLKLSNPKKNIENIKLTVTGKR